VRQLFGAVVGGGRGQDDDGVSHGDNDIAVLRLVTPR
jgi:hypothetical protein